MGTHINSEYQGDETKWKLHCNVRHRQDICMYGNVQWGHMYIVYQMYDIDKISVCMAMYNGDTNLEITL